MSTSQDEAAKVLSRYSSKRSRPAPIEKHPGVIEARLRETPGRKLPQIEIERELMREYLACRRAIEPQAQPPAREHGDGTRARRHGLLERPSRALLERHHPVLIEGDPVEPMRAARRRTSWESRQCRAGDRPDERRKHARATPKHAKLRQMPAANLRDTQRAPAVGAVAAAQGQASLEGERTLKHAAAPRPDRETPAARFAPARSLLSRDRRRGFPRRRA